MENETINPFAIAGVVGLLLGMGWIAANILGRIWVRVWAWIDDSKAKDTGPIMRFVMLSLGFEETSGRFRIYKFRHTITCEEADGWGVYFSFLIALSAVPMIALIAFTIYPLTLSIFGLYLTARLARFARRHKKLFDKHIKDPGAHK